MLQEQVYGIEFKEYTCVSGKASEIRDADKLRASAIEAATCDRFGNPVLSLGSKTTVGRALAAHEDFQSKRLPAFARFRDAEKSSASQSPSHASEEGSRPFDQNPIQGAGSLL